MKKFLSILLLTVSLFAQSQTWTPRVGVSMHPSVPGFYEFLPASYNGVDSLPCVIFMHGLGNVGNGTLSDLNNLASLGLPLEIANDISYYNSLGAVVICPQLNTTYPAWFVMEAIIDYVRTNYVVKRSRIYLTGLSMGGGAIMDWTEGGTMSKIAAIAPVCGTSVYNSTWADRIKAAGMPIYLFHGNSDGTVPFSRSTGWLTGLNGAPSVVPPALMDTLFGADHNIWSTVYPKTYTLTKYAGNMMQWMLSQERGGAATLVHTLIGNSGGTVYRWKLFSNNTFTVETHNGTTWISAAGFTQTMRGRVSPTNYRWLMNSNLTYTQQ
jgi:predicted peptidase